eukprot:4360178-Prymnesium_polylepis.1
MIHARTGGRETRCRPTGCAVALRRTHSARNTEEGAVLAPFRSVPPFPRGRSSAGAAGPRNAFR